MTKYLLLLVLLISGALYWSVDKQIKESRRADRMTENYTKSDDENKSLTLTYNELTKSQAARVIELTDSLNVKPKEVTKYVTIRITDSIKVPVETVVVKIDSNAYKFVADTGCFRVEGRVVLLDSIPSVILDKVSYNNTVEYLVYLERAEWQWWFIRSRFLGHKEAKLEVISECGESTVEEVILIKN